MTNKYDCGMYIRRNIIDELLEALEIILFNTYIQFNGCIFKQILGIPMGGNANNFMMMMKRFYCHEVT